VHLVQSAVEQGFSAVLIAEGSLPDPIVSYVNPALTKSIGCDAAEIQGRRLGAIRPLAPLTERLGAGLAPGEPFREGISVIDVPGGERFVEWRFSPVKHKTGVVGHWLLLFRDITERRRLEREILEISDRERQRMGQDLHDGICQQLAGIELMSQVLEQKLARRSKADAARAGEIARYVREAISQTRSVARGLSPVTLEAEGLESALRELAANTEKMFGIRCQVIIKESGARCELGAGIHYYRIAQEAVSNALKHGKATEIWIGLEARSDRTILSVDDNGSGLAGGWSAGGMGLRIMRYRAGMLGGTLVLEAREPRGTRVVCTTGPLKSQKPDRI
jgi:PAS domain S-box-containing protein